MSYRIYLIALALLNISGGLHPRRATASDLPAGAVLRFGETRFRAGGEVTDLLFSADGRELTSRVPLDSGTTRVATWDAATGVSLRTVTEPRRPGTRARWGTTIIPGSTRGVVIDADGVAVVRDFAANKDLVRLTGHFARITAVTVSPDGRRIATASADGLIRVWDAATFRPVVEAKGHSGAVRAVEVSADGRLALTTGADRTVRLWDLAIGRELRAFPTSGEANAAFSPDGAVVRISDSDRTVVRDPVTGLEVISPVAQSVDPFALAGWLLRQAGGCVAVAPDGRTVAVGWADGTIDLYEAATGQVRRRLTGPGPACLDLAFTPDGSRLLTAGADHAVLVWAVRLRDVPLAAELKRETSAAKLWDRLATGPAAMAYPAMARLAADPAAAVKMARLRLTTAAENPVADARAVELLEAIGTAEARALLRAWADADGARSREARAALARLGEPRHNRGNVQTISGSKP